MPTAKETWIDTGYDQFAQYGPKELKIERLSALVGISKSSFYYHFADMEVFCEHLFNRHLNQCRLIAEKERTIASIDPDLIEVLLHHKSDLLFNRQLRINRQVKRYSEILKTSDILVGSDFVTIWKKELSLKLSLEQLNGIFILALENFYLQINESTMNYVWMSAYFKELRSIIVRFDKP